MRHTDSQVILKRLSTGCYTLAGAALAATLGGTLFTKLETVGDFLGAIQFVLYAGIMGVLLEFALNDAGGWSE